MAAVKKEAAKTCGVSLEWVGESSLRCIILGNAPFSPAQFQLPVTGSWQVSLKSFDQVRVPGHEVINRVGREP